MISALISCTFSVSSRLYFHLSITIWGFFGAHRFRRRGSRPQSVLETLHDLSPPKLLVLNRKQKKTLETLQVIIT